MGWEVIFHPEFYEEFIELSEPVQDNLLAKARLLEQFGPQLGRPHVDTMYGSNYPNMKELRLDIANEIWRVAFAFDPKRKAVLLMAGDKRGKSKREFYASFLKKADFRYNQHLEVLRKK